MDKKILVTLLSILLLIFIVLMYLITCYALLKESKINYSNLIKELKSYYWSVIFTLVYFSYIFWVRLILVRLPQDLNHVEFNLIQILFISILCVIFFIMTVFWLFKFLQNLNNQKTVSKQLKIVIYLKKNQHILENNKIYQNILKHILNGPKNTFDLFYYNCQYGEKIEQVQKICIKILFIKKIYFFYKLLVLLLIPLIIEILNYIIYEHALRKFNFFKKHVEFVLLENGNIIVSDMEQMTNIDLLTKINLFYKIFVYKEKYDKYIFFFIVYYIFVVSLFIFLYL